VGCSWGDGTEFTRHEVRSCLAWFFHSWAHCWSILAQVEELREIYSRHAVGVEWQKGDVLLCDNLRTSHARCDMDLSMRFS